MGSEAVKRSGQRGGGKCTLGVPSVCQPSTEERQESLQQTTHVLVYLNAAIRHRTTFAWASLLSGERKTLEFRALALTVGCASCFRLSHMLPRVRTVELSGLVAFLFLLFCF
jgi:hypothetical protein